jgi:hypothetical protein
MHEFDLQAREESRERHDGCTKRITHAALRDDGRLLAARELFDASDGGGDFDERLQCHLQPIM